ncbi:MAG TPA: nuclear transport factor 2 family protein, partial [Nitrospiraceae bacterium]|nr:nuclear transport factor 2 family protein [Nitrospiraceae bacterium]
MTDPQTETAMERQVVLTVLTHLRNGNINDAIACFAQKFQFSDRGIGLEFKDRERLAEFFQKTREFYPDSSVQTERILVSGDY